MTGTAAPFRDAVPGRWRVALWYLGLSALLHLGWEFAQLPLYTISREPAGVKAAAVLHCTGGDILIAAGTLGLAIVLAGGDWPRTRSSRWRVVLCASALGVAYTIFSEWLNVEIRQSWAYEDTMPLVPLLGMGLTPALQWLILPPVALGLAFHMAERTRGHTAERTRDANSGGCDPANGATGA